MTGHYFSWIDALGRRTDFIEPTYVLTDTWNVSDTPVENQTSQSPYLDGLDLLDTIYSPKPMSLQFCVKASTKLDIRVLQRALLATFSPRLGQGWLYWTQEDGTVYRIQCTADSPGCPVFGTKKERGETWHVITLNLIAYDPFWYSGEPHLEFLGSVGASMFPFGFPFSVRPLTYQKSYTNLGDVDTPVILTVYGNVTNPTITNLSTGELIKINNVVASGELFVVDTLPRKISYVKYSTGGVASNGFQYRDSSSVPWMMKPGENSIAFTCTTSGSDAKCSIQWSDKFTGVGA